MATKSLKYLLPWKHKKLALLTFMTLSYGHATSLGLGTPKPSKASNEKKKYYLLESLRGLSQGKQSLWLLEIISPQGNFTLIAFRFVPDPDPTFPDIFCYFLS